MNKWQKAYLRGAYRGKSPGALYRERLGTVQDALDWIDDGDCLTWSTHGSEPQGVPGTPAHHRPPAGEGD